MNKVLCFASALRKEIKWYGSTSNNTQTNVRAGHLSMIYENGSLRCISCGKTELIRMIYPAVRDSKWLTINAIIEDETMDIMNNAFIITYKGSYHSRDINFSAKYRIEGRSDSTLNFSMDGEAIGETKKNRIGFCVLHPIEGNAGNKCNILHSNDSNEICKFPDLIAPHQPFTDIKAMKWAIADLFCSIDFHGDIFETEDQRNWTDASYKTYCTPLTKPFPVTLEKGEKISQKINVNIYGKTCGEEENNELIRFETDPHSYYDLPVIGIGRSTRTQPLTQNEILMLRKLKFDHYRTDICLFHQNWKKYASLAVNESVQLNYRMELALFFDENAVSQIKEFIQWHAEIKPVIALLTIYHKLYGVTPDFLVDNIIPDLKKSLPGVKICCGTNANFARLNRSRPEMGLNDFIIYPIHPQEHASDNTTLIENLKGQQYTVESVRRFSKGKGILISPVNIKRRFNANTENYEIPVPGYDFPPQVDCRMMSLFGACWTAGSIKYLCESAVSGITYYETAGERGILQGEFPSRWPERFHSVKGMIFPVYHILYYILKNKDLKVLKSNSSHSMKADILTLSDGQSLKFVLINFTPEQQIGFFPKLSGDYRMKRLNADTFAEVASDPEWLENTKETAIHLQKEITLEPFSVNFIE